MNTYIIEVYSYVPEIVKSKKICQPKMKLVDEKKLDEDEFGMSYHLIS